MESRYDEVKYYRFGEREKEKLLEKLKAILKGVEGIVLAYVFGSLTRRSSVRDIDLAIYTSPPLSFDELLNVGARIELEMGVSVDLVQLQDLEPSFRLKVLRQGLTVIDVGGMRCALVAQAFSELLDFNKCLEEARSHKAE